MHRNAPLTPQGRLRLCQRIEAGWTITVAAESMQISRQCAAKWWHRFQEDGRAGLEDRSSRPRSCPHQTEACLKARILCLRREERPGPARLAGRLGIPASTVHKVLVRHQVSRLQWLDRPTGRVIRRIEASRPDGKRTFSVPTREFAPIQLANAGPTFHDQSSNCHYRWQRWHQSSGGTATERPGRSRCRCRQVPRRDRDGGTRTRYPLLPGRPYEIG